MVEKKDGSEYGRFRERKVRERMRKDRGEIKRQRRREKVYRVIGEKEEGKVKGWDEKKRMKESLKCWKEKEKSKN